MRKVRGEKGHQVQEEGGLCKSLVQTCVWGFLLASELISQAHHMCQLVSLSIWTNVLTLLRARILEKTIHGHFGISPQTMTL